jgi:carbamoyl-phosphate synthase large subunit
MKKIFITAAGSDISSCIIRCVASDLSEYKIYGCDIKPFIPNMEHFVKYFEAPRYDTKEYWSVIQNICLKYGITHFFPTSEPEIIFYDKHRGFFSKNNIKLLLNNSKIINIATSKYKTAIALKADGILVPETFLSHSIPENIRFPLIVKPDFGRGGGTSYPIVHNMNELKSTLSLIPNAVVQEYIEAENDEYTVGIFSDGNTVSSIAFKRKLGFGGLSVLIESVREENLTNIAEKCAKVLDLKGAINIQLRYLNGQYYIFEINPRISSTAMFRHMIGFKDIVWWVRLSNSEKFEIFSNYDPGIIGVKSFDEKIYYPKYQNMVENNKN